MSALVSPYMSSAMHPATQRVGDILGMGAAIGVDQTQAAVVDPTLHAGISPRHLPVQGIARAADDRGVASGRYPLHDEDMRQNAIPGPARPDARKGCDGCRHFLPRWLNPNIRRQRY